uniref:Uncharacterized protein n=1 Tax=Rhizophora mucronata TaxID=61149 RepID=A0A2P2QZR8_RHIMU
MTRHALCECLLCFGLEPSFSVKLSFEYWLTAYSFQFSILVLMLKLVIMCTKGKSW